MHFSMAQTFHEGNNHRCNQSHGQIEHTFFALPLFLRSVLLFSTFLLFFLFLNSFATCSRPFSSSVCLSTATFLGSTLSIFLSLFLSLCLSPSHSLSHSPSLPLSLTLLSVFIHGKKNPIERFCSVFSCSTVGHIDFTCLQKCPSYKSI